MLAMESDVFFLEDKYKKMVNTKYHFISFYNIISLYRLLNDINKTEEVLYNILARSLGKFCDQTERHFQFALLVWV